MRLTTKIPIAKEKHFAPPPIIRNNHANSFLQQGRNFLLVFLLSIVYGVQANPLGPLQDVTISFDSKNNETVVLASWGKLTKTDSQNVIFSCIQNKEDKGDIVLREPVDLSNTKLVVPFSGFMKNKEYLVHSLICNLRVGSEPTDDIDIKGEELIRYFQVKNLYANSQYASWETPPNIKPANFIINLSSADFDEESVVLPGDQNTWHYEYFLEPGEYKLSIEIDVNNGYRYISTTHGFKVTDKINENGILISARQINGTDTDESGQDNTNYLLYIIPSAFAGAFHLVYFIVGFIAPFNCHHTSGNSRKEELIHTSIVMTAHLATIDFLTVFPLAPFAYAIYFVSIEKGTDKTDKAFLKIMGGALVFVAHSIFVPFSILAGFSTRVLVEKYLLTPFLIANNIFGNAPRPNYALPTSPILSSPRGEPPSYRAALNMIQETEFSPPTY